MIALPFWITLPAMVALLTGFEWFRVEADPFMDGRLQWVRQTDEKLRRRGYVCQEVTWNRRGRLTRIVWLGPPGVAQVEAEW